MSDESVRKQVMHNPGSLAAIDAGCICPRMDNNNGKRAPYPPDGWWRVPNCPYCFPSEEES